MRRVWLAAVGLAMVLSACGAEAPSRFDLVTPGAHTGAPLAPTPIPTPTPTPQAKTKPVSKSDKAVIKGWSDSLRHGHVKAATRYFAVPTLISNGDPGWISLKSRSDVHEFNRTLPCGAKLLKTRRSVDGFVVGVFRLTERPGAGECGTGTGNLAAVAFLIEKKHITRWVRVADEPPTPSPSGSATPTPDPADPSATATPDGADPSATPDGADPSATPDGADPSATPTPDGADPSAAPSPSPSPSPDPEDSEPGMPITA
jgi:hypothetical protein